jgi:hypothetical protein
MQSHQAVAAAQIVPVILTTPALPTFHEPAEFHFVFQPAPNRFTPPLQTSVLRL